MGWWPWKKQWQNRIHSTWVILVCSLRFGWVHSSFSCSYSFCSFSTYKLWCNTLTYKCLWTVLFSNCFIFLLLFSGFVFVCFAFAFAYKNLSEYLFFFKLLSLFAQYLPSILLTSESPTVPYRFCLQWSRRSLCGCNTLKSLFRSTVVVDVVRQRSLVKKWEESVKLYDPNLSGPVRVISRPLLFSLCQCDLLCNCTCV